MEVHRHAPIRPLSVSAAAVHPFAQHCQYRMLYPTVANVVMIPSSPP